MAELKYWREENRTFLKDVIPLDTPTAFSPVRFPLGGFFLLKRSCGEKFLQPCHKRWKKS